MEGMDPFELPTVASEAKKDVWTGGIN